MARGKVINPKTFFEIFYLFKVEKLKLAQILDAIEGKASYATISRICNNSVGGNKLYTKWKVFLIENNFNFEKFVNEFWRSFPYPEFWPRDILCRIVNESAVVPLYQIHKKYEFDFTLSTFKKLFEDGTIKTAVKKKCLKQKEITKNAPTSAPVKSNLVNELIEKIKETTGAKEVILKF